MKRSTLGQPQGERQLSIRGVRVKRNKTLTITAQVPSSGSFAASRQGTPAGKLRKPRGVVVQVRN